MISQKFSIASEDQITSFMSESVTQKEDDSLLDSIVSVTDLWVLANMNETFNEENNIHSNEENNIHSSIADNNPNVCSPD